MAITKGAKKAIKVSARKRVFNIRRKATLHDVAKKFNLYIKEGKKEEATKLIPELYKAIDKSAKGGIIKKNTAARKKSRFSKALAALK